jgi:hypothetical protein
MLMLLAVTKLYLFNINDKASVHLKKTAIFLHKTDNECIVRIIICIWASLGVDKQCEMTVFTQ